LRSGPGATHVSVAREVVMRSALIPWGLAIVGLLFASAGSAHPSFLQEPSAPQPLLAADLESAINKLGDLDYATRSAAAQAIRRTPGAQAVPALLRAVSEHADGYVRYRALVLLTGFDDPRTKDAMHESLKSPNDRLRAVAYSFFERNPDPLLVPEFLAALATEAGEFVRPSLVRALAAQRDNPTVRQALVREMDRGETFFRSGVIEALGDYHAQYAFDALTAVTALEGPLVGDAALALGKIGDNRALGTLAGLQRTAPRAVQPTIAAAICLLGVNCDTHERYLRETLTFTDRNSGFEELARTAAAGLGALGVAGHSEALEALFNIGVPSRDPARAPIAIAIATVALRNTPVMAKALEADEDPAQKIELVGEGLDMLEEDLDKERFFVTVRHAYWTAAEGSTTRRLMQTLIGRLGF
jgi:hypothetical protein